MDWLDSALQQRCAACQIAARCPFSRLPSSALVHFLSLAHLKIYGPGVTIFRQDDEAVGLFVIRSGMVKLSYITSIGNTLTVGFGGPGGILGLTAALIDRRYEVNAIALKETELEYIQKTNLSRFLYSNPTLAAQLLPIASLEAHNSLLELIDVGRKSPLAERMIHRLKELAGACGHSTSEGLNIDLSFTVQDLADSVGCSRQWTSKLLKEMEDRGLIRRKGCSITLTPLALEM